METVFVRSLTRNFAEALALLGAALGDCPDRLWETDLWPQEAPTRPGPLGGLHGSAPWFLGYHALSVLDYDLAAELEPWAPVPPFDDNTFSFPNRVFTRDELLGYVGVCRDRVLHTLDGLGDDRARLPLPTVHRKSGITVGELIGSLPLHVIEHASQIRQFLTASGVRVRPMPGDQNYRG